MIKIIVSDLDGTLLNTDKQITPRLLNILNKAEQNNITLIPATGRVLSAVPQNVINIPAVKYIITSNGACVYKKDSKKPIFEQYLNPEHVKFVLFEAKKYNSITEIFSNGKAYIEKEIYKYIDSFGITSSHLNYIKSTRTPININEFMLSNIESIENINIIFNDMALREKFRNEIKNNICTSITSSAPNNIEISSIKATKGNAIKNICDSLNIKNNEVIAFGDSENDIDMLEFAKIGVIMENASPELKQQKFIVSPSCDDYGVAKMLEKILDI